MIAKNKLAATNASGIEKRPTKFLKNCSSDFFKITSGRLQWDIDIAVFIDLKKAFDPVDHNILLNKLMRYGIKDNDYNGSSHIYRIGLNADMQWSSFKQPNNIMRSTTGLYPWTAVIFYIHQRLSECIPNIYADDTNITANHTNFNKVEDVLNKDLDILYIDSCRHID